jgi:hypothetical protein
MFDIISQNMREIAPTGNTLEDARAARVTTLRSYANGQNLKSQAILSKLGLNMIGETPRGYRYQGRAEDARDWFFAKFAAL